MKEEFVSRQQVKLLSERILKAEETNAAKELNYYMWDLYKENSFKPMNILVVGAGGSYPAAVFAKHAIHNEMRTPNVEAVTPQTAIRMLTQFDYIVNCDWKPKYNLVIGISYSGKTPDIISVYELCLEKDYPFILITGADKSTLNEHYKDNKLLKIVSYFNKEDSTGKERGMISMASTLAPIIIFDDNFSKYLKLRQEYLEKAKNYVDELNIKEIAASIKKSPIIHVFYEWDTLPTALDIESKFTESGVANVILHEKKNFSHGRYTSLYKQDFALVINLTRYAALYSNFSKTGSLKDITEGYNHKYDENISKFLSKICEDKNVHYIELGTLAMMAGQWNIEAMTKLPYLITAIGEELGIDISKPLKPFPEEAVILYDYKGEF